ncbi:SH3 domain-containing protein [Kaistella sp. DKR-2]|uniref:SH3 domain-containing protein n=1 Tax=Kaistella soli TaxID=2849654 RepID=UPI001C26FF01|nr:SH3 domain-containing protein [Kaistella soli]MBU8884154.1 SH3 domain-containing protein [Kaistella soli]
MNKILQIVISTFLLLSCIDAKDIPKENTEEARCTGSSACAACSNCSRCAHCSAGGSCGVCSGKSSGRGFSSYKTAKKKNKPLVNNRKKSAVNPNYHIYSQQSKKNISDGGKNLAVGTYVSVKKQMITIRKQPDVNSQIVEILPKGSKLTILNYQKSWYKIKVKQSGKTGYIQYRELQ